MKKIFVLSLIILVLTSTTFAGTVNLPKTGQTKCYDTSHQECTCTGTGQDGEIQAGVAWPSPRFTDNGDGTVTDNLTGLMWMKNSNAPGPVECIPNRTMAWSNALLFVECLNNNTYLEHADWRLPNINELESVINLSQFHPSDWLATQGISASGPNYWSSTSFGGDATAARILYMPDGSVSGRMKNKSDGTVWPVRMAQDNSYPAQIWKTGQTTSYATGDDGNLQTGVAWPSPRFTDNGDGTVTDNLTGLTWTKNANLPNETQTWFEALDYVSGMNSELYPNYGYKDWRLWPFYCPSFNSGECSRTGPKS